MDFFAHQDRARRQTRYLLLLFVLAAVAIVIAVDFVVFTAAVNIGNMHVSVPAADGLCYAVLGVSEPIDAELAATIRDLAGIQDVRMVDLT